MVSLLTISSEIRKVSKCTSSKLLRWDNNCRSIILCKVAQKSCKLECCCSSIFDAKLQRYDLMHLNFKALPSGVGRQSSKVEKWMLSQAANRSLSSREQIFSRLYHGENLSPPTSALGVLAEAALLYVAE